MRSQRESSLRTSGAFTEGGESSQNKTAYSSTVWVLAGDILVPLLGEINLTRKLEIYDAKVNRSRKAAEALAGRSRSRHWFVTLVLL